MRTSRNFDKCAVLGLDGATFRLLLPLVERGLLPNFADLISNGSRARLLSTVPWQTPVAWTTFATGVNPGKHGIYGWWTPDGQQLTTVSGKHIVAARFWEILSSAGIRVGIINVPMSYPARPLNGFMISGFDTPFEVPAADPVFTYPRDLLERLSARGLDYVVLPERRPNEPLAAILSRWAEVEKTRIDASIVLAKEYDAEFLQVNLFFTDFIAHRGIDRPDIMEEVYRIADRFLGHFRESLGRDSVLFVVSDHGSCPISRFVMIHNALQESGLLAFHPWLSDENVGAYLGPNASRSQVETLLAQLRREGPPLRAKLYDEIRRDMPGANLGFATIDWDHTRAFSVSDYGQVWINRRHGRAAVRTPDEYRATVRDIEAMFLSLEDPDDGRRIVTNVVPREEFYCGPYLDDAPDLTPLPSRDHYYFCQVYSFYAAGEDRSVCMCPKGVDPIEAGCIGDHDPYGIFIANGHNIPADNVIPDARISDIAPTILSLFGLRGLQDYDGVVLDDLFGRPRPHQLRREGGSGSIAPESLRERIKSLGYRI